jgi:imidazole glycerol phosphate synthase glutamine amidotransferase subunit
MKFQVDLVDIGIGNIGSVKRCLERLQVDFRVVNADSHPDGSRPLILPGVGQFGAVMKAFQRNQFDNCLRKLILTGTPYLGICVGLQILFEGSEESAGVSGLGLCEGKVIRFQQGKIPQIGWNLVKPTIGEATEKADNAGYAYFVNSYYAMPKVKSIISYTADYYGEFCAALQSNNITAVQFHPEKSADFGNNFLREWLRNVH